MFYSKSMIKVVLGIAIFHAGAFAGDRVDPYRKLKISSNISDPYKKLKISSKISDPHKKLKTSKANLSENKKLLVKSRYVSKPQLPRILAECKAELGVAVYGVAEKKAYKLIEKRADQMWGIEQNSFIRDYYKRKEVRDRAKLNKIKTVKQKDRNLARIDKKYKKKYEKLDDEDKAHKEKIAVLDLEIMNIVEK